MLCGLACAVRSTGDHSRASGLGFDWSFCGSVGMVVYWLLWLGKKVMFLWIVHYDTHSSR